MIANDVNITIKGKYILKKVANDERIISYKNLLLKSGNRTIDNYDFFLIFGALYDLLINLLNMKISFKKAALQQKEMVNKILELRNFVLLEQKKH